MDGIVDVMRLCIACSFLSFYVDANTQGYEPIEIVFHRYQYITMLPFQDPFPLPYSLFVFQHAFVMHSS